MPSVPAAAVPLSVAGGPAVKEMPVGNTPVCVMAGAGKPVAAIVNVFAIPGATFADEPLVKDGGTPRLTLTLLPSESLSWTTDCT